MLSFQGALSVLADDNGGSNGNQNGGSNGSQGNAIYVAPGGSLSHSGRSCESAQYASINAAVGAAPVGGSVVVCAGTYKEDVLIQKSLSLTGRKATIDATGLENAVHVVAAHVKVAGLTLENATGEGVLVGVDRPQDAWMLPPGRVIGYVTIENNRVVNDNKGFSPIGVFTCLYPGDCGGGIHFNVTTHSVMRGNYVNGNADGVLLTDDYGPNSYNLVEDNVVTNNVHECGITLPSHNPNAVNYDPVTGVVTSRNPSVGGVYGNIVRDNVADGNGTDAAPPQFGGGGSGAGIGVFASGPGFGAYDNLIEGNEASGNGLAGITVHSHGPFGGGGPAGGGDATGNKIIDNTLGTNNLLGDPFDGNPSNMVTTGINVFSAGANTLTITDNKIHDDKIGIWVSTTVNAIGLDENDFRRVSTPIVRG
jgi:hypothetical protein